MNGWWWNPAEPGRGFFVEYRDGRVRVACCHYDEKGRALWHRVGPLPLGADDTVAGRADPMPSAAGSDRAAAWPFTLALEGPSRARIDWGGVHIALQPQHPESHEGGAASQGSSLTGWWQEDAASSGCAIACEQVGPRIFAALLAPDGWLLLEGARGPRRTFEGKWWRFEGGQSLDGAHRAPAGRELAAASLAASADGNVVVRMPGGEERRFGRMPFAAPGDASTPRRAATAIRVHVSSPATERARSGIVPLAFAIDAGPRFVDTELRLTLESPGRGCLYDGVVRLTGWTRNVELHVNSHLLPDGAVPVTARIAQAGTELWSDTVTLLVANTGPLAQQVRASLVERGGPLVIEGAVDSTHFDIANRALWPWFEHPDAAARIDAMRRAGRITEREEADLRQFVDEGFMVLPAAIEESLLARIDGELDDVIAARTQGYQYGSSQRIVNLHVRYAGVRALWRHPAVMRYLELVFGVPARPCQTLTYIFGSQQEAHQDTAHLTPFPAGYMCGVWVALEDVRPNSGELEVFPGTHRLPRVYMDGAGCAKVTDGDWSEFSEKIVSRYRDMLREGGFGKVTYRPKRGTVLVWHENLLHGGSVRVDMSLSRRSIVSHYFADGAIAFYDSTGRPGYMD